MEAAACVEPGTGRIFYLLSEQTFESNVDPRTPRWSARFFGTAEQCLAKVLWWAGFCEGGTTKGATGYITSTTYLARWRKALSAPVELPLQVLRFKIGTGFYDVREVHRPRLAQTFEKHGHRLEAGADAEIDMARAGALSLIQALQEEASETGAYIWRLFARDRIDLYSRPLPELGVPVPKASKIPVDVRVLKYPAGEGTDWWDHGVFLAIESRLRHVGSSGMCGIEDFIQEIVVPAELKRPGVAESAILAFKKIAKEPEDLPASTRVLLKRGDPADYPGGCKQHGERFDALATRLGHAGALEVQTTVGALVAAGVRWKELHDLWRSLVAFSLDEASAESVVQASDQLALCL